MGVTAAVLDGEGMNPGESEEKITAEIRESQDGGGSLSREEIQLAS